jgi:hypothetical protein
MNMAGKLELHGLSCNPRILRCGYIVTVMRNANQHRSKPWPVVISCSDPRTAASRGAESCRVQFTCLSCAGPANGDSSAQDG